MIKSKITDIEKKLKLLEQENIAYLSEKEVYKKAFQENLKLMKNLLDNAGFGSILIDQEKNIVRANDIVCELTRYSCEELLHLTVDRILTTKEKLDQFMSNNISYRFEDVILRKDGSSFISKCLFAPNLNIYGKTTGYHLLIEDITELKNDEEKLRVEKTYFKHLFDDSPEAIAIIDNNGQITNSNTKFTRLFRYSPEECYFASIDILLPSRNFSNESKEFLRNTFNNRRQYIETIRKRKDNILIDVSITSTPVTFDENTRMAYLMFQDIRERKETERRLQEAKIKAEESDKLKSAFLANLSHEIRTPMNAIVGFSGLIAVTEDITMEQKENYSKNITTNCENLVQLIDNIIDISKIEAKQIKLTKSRFELISLLENLFDTFIAKLDETNNSQVELKRGYNSMDKLSIFTDENRLKQVFYNLLDNAIKYTLKGYVKYGFILEKKNYIHFYVEDTGIGIRKSDQQIIFNRFTKIENNTNKLFRGTGIGLYIAKRLIEEMGGQIYVESELEKGSKFFFMIPLNPVEKEEITKQEDKATKRDLDLTNKKILIVEDTESSYAYLEALLSHTNANIYWLKNGNDAISSISEQNNKYDLILLDIQLPDVTGYEVARAIRKIDQSTPIIAQTAYVFQNDRSKSLQAGCNRYLSKPIKADDLFQIIKQLLEIN